jgi:hypothetical protein
VDLSLTRRNYYLSLRNIAELLITVNPGDVPDLKGFRNKAGVGEM